MFATAHKLRDYESNTGELKNLRPPSNTLASKHKNAHMPLTKNERKRWVKSKINSYAKQRSTKICRLAVQSSLHFPLLKIPDKKQMN